jgi:hypothetical protein
VASRRRWPAIILAAGLVAALGGSANAASDPASGQCTESGVQALAEAPLIPDVILSHDQTRPRIVDTLLSCRYGFYRDGSSWTFRENEPFLGAVLWFSFRDPGMTREESIADIVATTDRVWLARVQPDGSVGPAVEQHLSQTPVQQIMYPGFGLLVYQQRYFIGHLEAGDYVSTWASTFYGDPDSTATVMLHIEPAP